MRAPDSGLEAPYSERGAISPGISVSVIGQADVACVETVKCLHR